MTRLNQIPIGRAPHSASLAVRRSMQSNKSSRTRPEIFLGKILRKEITRNDLPGTPDFVFPRKRLAIFLHGCFWHRCPRCGLTIPRSNRQFWAAKFERNKERDRIATRKLGAMGWKVLVVWEHELKENPTNVRKKIYSVIDNLKKGKLERVHSV